MNSKTEKSNQMSHNNLLALYCYIEDQKRDLEGELTATVTGARQKNAARGRMKVLTEFEAFLHDHLDRKLPRRIYRQLKSQANSCDIRYAVDK